MRSYRSAVRARARYRQLREVTLAAVVYNVEQAVKQGIILPSADSIKPLNTNHVHRYSIAETTN